MPTVKPRLTISLRTKRIIGKKVSKKVKNFKHTL